jgi:hypothetical protein
MGFAPRATNKVTGVAGKLTMCCFQRAKQKDLRAYAHPHPLHPHPTQDTRPSKPSPAPCLAHLPLAAWPRSIEGQVGCQVKPYTPPLPPHTPATPHPPPRTPPPCLAHLPLAAWPRSIEGQVSCQVKPDEALVSNPQGPRAEVCVRPAGTGRQRSKI